ncbi:hypothetical protein [Clostridium baratii]
MCEILEGQVSIFDLDIEYLEIRNDKDQKYIERIREERDYESINKN